FLDSFIEKNISVRDDCSFKTYFVNKTDFYNQLENSRKNASPITAISLSDYNHLLKMAGYDEISLRDHEFTTQWLSITPQDSISAYLEAHKSIKTDGGDLQLADISAHTVDLGEDFYNFQSVIYIVPDHICNKLTSANTFRYMMADKTISYDIAQELKSYFENSSLTDSLVTYNITMRTIEVNDNSAIIFIMQTGLTYSAIILFVTCFTILALQQLSDSGKYKYRFRVLRNMGVEEPHIRKLILKQLAVWFGVPVILALILSGAFLVFLFVGFHMQIAVYIGVQRLVQQLLIVLAILGVLLISYFISTWVLFNKSASA
ncbi:ABC transporter permease, partial [Ruminococcus sp. AM46-18]